MLQITIKSAVATVAILLVFSHLPYGLAAASNEEVCDVTADFALGVEDYTRAIILHRRFLQSHNHDALAHYHLGFAYGMVGQKAREVTEYVQAAAFGLHKWDLFLNLGLAYLEQQQFAKAVAAFQTAVALGPEHTEAHLDLAIAYEKEQRLEDALQEVSEARRLAPHDPDAANTNAIICAELGDLTCARDIWTQLVGTSPRYAPARVNLWILDSLVRSSETAANHGF